MPNPLSRARFQIHLSTAIVLMFTAGALIWANTSDRPQSVLDECQHLYYTWSYSHGWPFHFFHPTAWEASGMQMSTVERGEYDYLALTFDALIAFLIPFSVWFACEWQIRRRETKKGA